jgi:hypothetical protein
MTKQFKRNMLNNIATPLIGVAVLLILSTLI